MSEKERRVSRRQFLSYTLTGVGGFMAATITMPLATFAIDPILRKKVDGEMVAVAQVKDITSEPTRVDFKVDVVDGWYKSEETKTAWVYKNEAGDIVALSPKCKHLGCTVAWNGSSKFQNEFFCPCHDGRYTKDGKNVPNTPPTAPLDAYEQEVKDGTLYLGKAVPKGGK